MFKNYSKNYFIAFTLFCAVLLLSNSFEHPTTGSGGYTGAPGDGACNTCHSGSSTLEGDVSISGLPATIDPNTLYNLTVTVNNTNGGADRAGFQVVSLKSDNSNAGTFSVPGGENNVSIKMVNGKSYSGHQPAKDFIGNTVTFNVDWTSPASSPGDITLYAVGNIANGSGGNSGDEIVFASNVTSLSGGAPLSGDFSNITDALCADSNDGSATFNASGGSGGYMYEWDNGESTATATMLSGGNHDLTVTDNASNSITESVFINAPDPIVPSLDFQEDATCNGGTGSATLSSVGGTPGYLYFWGGGIEGSTQTNLAAGTYFVTVTDLNLCEEFITVVIDEPPAISIDIPIMTEPSCNGFSDGVIVAEASGGNGGFIYNWLDGIGIPNGGTLTDIPAGTYQLEVLDQEGCLTNTSITIGEPDPILPNLTSVDVSCFDGSDGTATAAASGGVGNFTYAWSNGSSGATINDLIAGSYEVTATDGNGCESIESVSVAQPASSVVTETEINIQPNCGNSDGQITALATGGTPGYVFTWSTGFVGAVLSDIPSGVYSVTATDDNGCTMAVDVTLEDSDGVSLAANDVVNNDCFGGENGAATISASGSGTDYTYQWSNGGTNETEENLAAGDYTITVTDDNGCNGEILITITEPDQISLTNETVEHLLCHGDTDGSITVEADGGTGTLSYSWNTGNTGNTIMNLIAGAYTLMVTDENNCVESFSISVIEPEEITLANNIATTPLCVGDENGSIMVEIEGGTGDYMYMWNTGDNTSAITDLEAGDYEVSVVDDNECEKVFSFTLDNPPSIDMSTESNQPTCFGGSDGNLTVTATGGTGMFTYQWNNGQDSSYIENLTSGEYTVTATDENGCIFEQTLMVDQPTEIAPNASATDETESGANDGTATADPSNGVSDIYTYLWSNDETTQTIENLEPGAYTVTVTDENGCTSEQTVVVNSGDCNISANVETIQISCFGNNNGALAVELMNAEDPTTFMWNNDETGSSIGDLEPGEYSVTITDVNNCQIILEGLVIVEPDDITATDPIITEESAAGANDGSIDIMINGGTGDLTLELLDGNGSSVDISMINALSAGDYTIEATDENGCTKVFGPYTVGVGTAISEDILNSISIYPLPARDLLNIEVDATLESNPSLISLHGQKLDVDVSKNNNKYMIDLNGVNAGIYIVKMKIENEFIFKKVIILN